MHACLAIVLLVIMHIPCGRTAVANLPPTSSETQIDVPERGLQTNEEKDPLMLFSTDMPDDVQLGCKELRAKRYISDGFCTSLKAIKEVVCAGQCMPIKEQNLPWWAEFTKYWAKPKFREWRCVDAVTKLKKVQLMCQNGETRTYKIKIVKSCRCKSYEREPNRTERRYSQSANDADKEQRKIEKLKEREERKRKKREKKLEREREKRAKRQLRKSSRESRKQRHSVDKERRHERRRHKTDKNDKSSTKVVDSVTDTRHKISQTLSNNDSPTE